MPTPPTGSIIGHLGQPVRSCPAAPPLGRVDLAADTALEQAVIATVPATPPAAAGTAAARAAEAVLEAVHDQGDGIEGVDQLGHDHGSMPWFRRSSSSASRSPEPLRWPLLPDTPIWPSKRGSFSLDGLYQELRGSLYSNRPCRARKVAI